VGLSIVDPRHTVKHVGDSDCSNPNQGSGNQGSLITEWLITEEAAKYLKVSVPSLRNMTSNGKIPYYKFDRRNRYRIEDLRQLLLRNPRGAIHGY
jgi:excisionase family DNA binding protein